MSFEGQIIEFAESDGIKIALVRRQERDRLHVVDVRGRQTVTQPAKVIAAYGRFSETELQAKCEEIRQQVERMKADVDPELLWQSLPSGGGEFATPDLSRLFFGSMEPQHTSAIFHTLSADSLYFKRTGMTFTRRTEPQVEAELTRRRREKENEEKRSRTTALLQQIERGTTPDDPETQPILDSLQSWLLRRQASESAALWIELTGGRAKDSAFDVLQRHGRIPAGTDRFLASAGIEGKFKPDLVELSEKVSVGVEASGREDWTHLPAISIDDEDTREIDDALTWGLSGSNFVVGIHIADVAAFVHRGDALDLEAARRSSTIYLPTVTVPMFPPALSMDHASLNAGQVRPAFTVEATFDRSGNLVRYRLLRTWIRVSTRFTYEELDRTIADDPAFADVMTVARARLTMRQEKGALMLRRKELKIRVSGEPPQIEVKPIVDDSASRTLVSEMMILLNGLVADYAAVQQLPIIYRTQEPREALPPEVETLPEPLKFDRIRRTLRRSRLSLTPDAHSGLGLTAYTQASSPLRRYADLVTQRQIVACLQGESPPYSREELLSVLSHAESVEQEVRMLEERSNTFWLIRYLEAQGGAPLNGVVIDAHTVELADFGLRGKVPKVAANPGTAVQVRIVSSNPVKGEIRMETTA